ncbi:MAG: hypothetical protein PHI40_06770 [Caldisericia bacterium]|nr:hypothetical protein [Prolixibacteraceae bacterium]MDD4615087.1 hypothetical protein [Caldisericia bacterium]
MSPIRYLVFLFSLIFLASCSSTTNLHQPDSPNTKLYTSIKAVAVDVDQNLLIAGNTTSPYLPRVEAFQNELCGESDAFLTRITSYGDIAWSTYLGGSLQDEVKAMHCNDQGDIIIAGWTQSTDFPGNQNIRKSENRSKQFFLSAFSPDGQLQSTQILNLPDLSQISSHKVRLSDNHIFMVADFPSNNEFSELRQSLPVVHPYTPEPKGVIYALFADRDGNIIWASWFGGSGISRFFDCTIDDINRHVYITGSTKSDHFPMQNAWQESLRNYNKFDAFVSCFTYDGQLVWSTPFGGNQDDESYSMVIDNNTNIIISGCTESNDFPIQNTHSLLQESIEFDDEYTRAFSFCAKFTPQGDLMGSTYLRHTLPIVRYDIDSINNSQQLSFSASNFITNLDEPIHSVNPYQPGPMQEEYEDHVAGSSNIIGTINSEGQYDFFSFYGGILEKGEVGTSYFDVIHTQLNNDNKMFVIGYFRSIKEEQLPLISFNPAAYETKDQIAFVSIFDTEGTFTKILCFGLPNE